MTKANQGGRRKGQTSKVKQNKRKAIRRQSLPQPKLNKEQRQDLQIIVSASQGDIYVWAISMLVMVGILITFVLLALFMGGS